MPTDLKTEGQIQMEAHASADDVLVAACADLDKIQQEMSDKEMRAAMKRWNTLRAEKKAAMDVVEAAADAEFGPEARPDGERQIVVDERWRLTVKYKTVASRQTKAARRRSLRLEDFGKADGTA